MLSFQALFLWQIYSISHLERIDPPSPGRISDHYFTLWCPSVLPKNKKTKLATSLKYTRQLHNATWGLVGHLKFARLVCHCFCVCEWTFLAVKWIIWNFFYFLYRTPLSLSHHHGGLAANISSFEFNSQTCGRPTRRNRLSFRTPRRQSTKSRAWKPRNSKRHWR